MHGFLPHSKIKAPSKSIRSLDKLILLLSFITPLMVLPQIIEIIIKNSSENISIYTWLAWLIIDIPWLVYGIIHRIKPLTYMYILWLLIHAVMVFLIVFY